MKTRSKNTESTENTKTDKEVDETEEADATDDTAAGDQESDETDAGDSEGSGDSGESDSTADASEESDKDESEDQEADGEDEKTKVAKTKDPQGEISADQIIGETEDLDSAEESDSAEVDLSNDKDVLAKLLVNPTKVIQEIQQSAVAKVRKELQDETNAKTAWKNFYAENRDLEPFPELVQLVTARLNSQWKKSGKVPKWEDGKKVLAKEVRKLVSKVRGSDSDVEEIETGSKAAVVSSSGNPAPRTAVTKAAGRTSFVDQVRSFQERHLKSS